MTSYLILAGIGQAYDHALTSPRFEARVLEFAPTPHVSHARLRETLGLAPGTNMLALDLDALAAALVADPWIKHARIVRRLPDTLIVDIEEHVPAAILLAGGFFLVDEDGHPFKALAPGERGDLPVITGIDGWELLQDPAGVQARMGRALEVLAAYRAEPRPRLGEVHVGADGAVTLYTARRGTQLHLGRGAPGVPLRRFDALRRALGADSEALAAVHLDGDDAAEDGAWLVASFFRDAQVAGADARGSAAVPDPRGPGGPVAPEAGQAAPPRPSWRRDGPRIPRHD